MISMLTYPFFNLWLASAKRQLVVAKDSPIISEEGEGEEEREDDVEEGKERRKEEEDKEEEEEEEVVVEGVKDDEREGEATVVTLSFLSITVNTSILPSPPLPLLLFFVSHDSFLYY